MSAVGLRGQRSWTEGENKRIEEVLARVLEKISAAFDGLEAQRVRDAERARQRIEQEKQWAELQAKREVERKEQEKIAQHEHRLKDIAKVRRKNLWIATQRWEESQRALAYIDSVEKKWLSANSQLSPAQIDWLSWARLEAEKLNPGADNYPDAESAKLCDPSGIPMGGPYPSVRELAPSEFSHQEPKPYSAYSQHYGYSRY